MPKYFIWLRYLSWFNYSFGKFFDIQLSVQFRYHRPGFPSEVQLWASHPSDYSSRSSAARRRPLCLLPSLRYHLLRLTKLRESHRWPQKWWLHHLWAPQIPPRRRAPFRARCPPGPRGWVYHPQPLRVRPPGHQDMEGRILQVRRWKGPQGCQIRSIWPARVSEQVIWELAFIDHPIWGCLIYLTHKYLSRKLPCFFWL